MEGTKETTIKARGRVRKAIAGWFGSVPLLGLLFGALVAVLLERYFGTQLALAVGLEKIPALFGVDIITGKPALIPGALTFVILIYILPVGLVAKLTAPLANAIARGLMTMPLIVPALAHLVLFYAILHIWSGISDYRLLTVKFILIAIIVTQSLNLVNGYMGEFSCSHPGFMALGAYGSAIFTVGLFTNSSYFGDAAMNPALGPWIFPLTLIIGGFVAALGALVIAIPSFRTRGDYLAIISLAFTFIIKSMIENIDTIGGPRGLLGEPDYANLPTVFIWTVLCLWTINNYVRSTLGKATNAIRDDELAAEAMTVDTRMVKATAFMFAAFWAGVAGGLFAHVQRFINPASFGLQKLAEILAMVYFGGLNSAYGSIVGAVSINLLGEMLRPLEIFKWIIIPLMLILVMIYRPTGLIAFKEFDARAILQPRDRKAGEV